MFLPMFLLPPALRPRLPEIPAPDLTRVPETPRHRDTRIALEALRNLRPQDQVFGRLQRHRGLLRPPARCALGAMAYALDIPRTETNEVVRKLAERTLFTKADLHDAMHMNDSFRTSGPGIARSLELRVQLARRRAQ